jgi:hypothetical protein
MPSCKHINTHTEAQSAGGADEWIFTVCNDCRVVIGKMLVTR